ncbi:protein translocase subunit SecF [Sphingoaurantiacus capsulatus]|uniref:Protein-export membrane protein SecF n=1 Tax=Sphingoaurantiacus capsulatus TaxID=1771310 RepID=A0ABV7XCR7_9SPHN
MRLLKVVPDNTNFRFVRLRWVAFAFTLLLTIGSIALVATRGLNLGVDFVGGLMIDARFDQPVQLDELRTNVDSLGVGTSALQNFGGLQNVLIRLPLPPGDEVAVQRTVQRVQTALRANHPDVSFARVETVSGKVSDELLRDGAWAIVLSMAAIVLFTWARFEWHFGVSTIVALIHDVTVTLGFFALTQLEFDLNIVAAVLTIIGYSLNDKVVIDDRIRENLRKYRQMDIGPLIDLSVNETLSRTYATTTSLSLALASLLFFGPDVIFGFAAAMLLGIVIGTYSSVFVSSSLLISLGVSSKTFAPDDATAKAEKKGA